MKYAVCLSYSVDQNQPSRPIGKLFGIPADQWARDKILKGIFKEYVCDVAEHELTIVEGGPDQYGDLIVELDDSLFMFVTYVELT